MYFFDLDGTITDSNGLWARVDEDFLARRGLPCTEEYRENVTHCIFKTAAIYTKELFGLTDSIESIQDEWLELARDHYAVAGLKPGVEQYLRLLHGRGERMAIITSCMPMLLETALKNHGLYDLFEFVVYTNDLGVEKRLPDAFLHGAKLAGVKPEDCLMFEDSPVAAGGAVAAGMKVIGVYDEYFESRRGEFEPLCQKYIESYFELM